MHKNGIDAVVARLKMAFKVPLRSGDEFVCRMRIKKEGIRFVFFQDIFRVPDETMVLRSQIDIVCLVNGQLGECPELEALLEPYFEKA